MFDFLPGVSGVGLPSPLLGIQVFQGGVTAVTAQTVEVTKQNKRVLRFESGFAIDAAAVVMESACAHNYYFTNLVGLNVINTNTIL